jgi:hypothetical protein
MLHETRDLALHDLIPIVKLPAVRTRTAFGGRRGPARAASPERLFGVIQNDAAVTWRRGLMLLRAISGATTGAPARMAAVQHGSTATHPDTCGLAGTREDGDLHGWTRVDVLPPDGMQEVSGSSPLSSTRSSRSCPWSWVSRSPSRSSDRHLTAGLNPDRWHSAARTGLRRQARQCSVGSR